MVKHNDTSSQSQPNHPFALTIVIRAPNRQMRDTLLAAFKPEFPAIDSKRVVLQVKRSRNQLVFHLAATDVTALRAAATSLMRLYVVADGVQQLMVKKK